MVLDTKNENEFNNNALFFKNNQLQWFFAFFDVNSSLLTKSPFGFLFFRFLEERKIN